MILRYLRIFSLNFILIFIFATGCKNNTSEVNTLTNLMTDYNRGFQLNPCEPQQDGSIEVRNNPSMQPEVFVKACQELFPLTDGKKVQFTGEFTQKEKTEVIQWIQKLCTNMRVADVLFMNNDDFSISIKKNGQCEGSGSENQNFQSYSFSQTELKNQTSSVFENLNVCLSTGTLNNEPVSVVNAVRHGLIRNVAALSLHLFFQFYENLYDKNQNDENFQTAYDELAYATEVTKTFLTELCAERKIALPEHILREFPELNALHREIWGRDPSQCKPKIDALFRNQALYDPLKSLIIKVFSEAIDSAQCSSKTETDFKSQFPDTHAFYVGVQKHSPQVPTSP